MFYPRAILPFLEKEIDTSEIVLLTGMRQVGKTTILKHLYSLIPSNNKAYFDFENTLDARLFEEIDFDAVLGNLAGRGIDKNKKAYLFIDEIQNLPIISRVAKYLYDHYQTKFFLTGSSSFYLKNLFPESMAGRKVIYEIFPLTFSEFLTFKGIRRAETTSFSEKAIKKNETRTISLKKAYGEYLEFGGFPKVVLETDPAEKRKRLADVFSSYFEKDVKTLSDISDRSRLRELIFLLVPRVGSRVEIEKLSKELSMSRETIYSYLSFLEQTYFISLLPRFSRSVDVSSAGRRKLFFADTGLANFLNKASLGQLLENSVFQNLRPDHKLSFYHKDNQEIDFIVGESIGLEVKTTAAQRDIFRLKKISSALGLTERYIVSFNWSPQKEVVMASDL